MKLILFSPSQQANTEIGFLLNMFEQGLPAYHLKKANYSTKQLKKFIEDIPEKYHNRIVIHSHHELASKYELKGVYLTRSHKKRKYSTWLRLQWLKFRKRSLEVSGTVRSIDSLMDYNPKYNYVFLSPVFDSVSGNSQAGYSPYNIQYALKHSKYQTIARGGVSIDNIEQAHNLGFAGVAFYSTIWKTKNPYHEFLKVKEKFKELNLPME